MKPFDLSAALKGAPVITRSGRIVKVIGHLPEDLHPYSVVGCIQGYGRVARFTKDGGYEKPAESYNNLFMAPVKVRRWLNIFDQSGTETAELFDSEAAALRNVDDLRGEGYDVYVAAMPIEWEE